MEREIPVWEKYVLSTEEASSYFNIGINKLRRLINDHKDADWVLWNASHACIKRLKFERFIDSINAV